MCGGGSFDLLKSNAVTVTVTSVEYAEMMLEPEIRFDVVFDTKNASQYAISYLLQQFSIPIPHLSWQATEADSYSTERAQLSRAGRHQPTLFSFEISRREGGRATHRRLLQYPIPFLFPFPPLYISGPTNNGTQGFNNPLKKILTPKDQ